jgi:mycofactocin precursor
MAETNPQAAPPSTVPVEAEPSEEPTDRLEEELADADLLVEEISIDGMCGVY